MVYIIEFVSGLILVEKTQDAILHKKGTVDTAVGTFNLISIRNKVNPVFRFNTHSLILLVSSYFLMISSITGNKFSDLNLFLLMFTLDTILASLLTKPLEYHKNGLDVKKPNDFKVLFYNYDIGSPEIKTYFKFLLPRLFVYALMLLTNIKMILSDNLRSFQVLSYILFGLLFSFVGILLIVSVSMAGTGLLIDDYMNEGASHKAWKSFRLEVSNSALELDKLISRINNSQTTVINQDNRQRLANTLFKLRNFLVIENQPDPDYTPDMKIRFTQAERDISQELLQNLKKDKCVVCYSQLANSNGPFLVCPICGQGGHKDHIEEWFASKTNCPGCTTDLSSSSFLLLS